VVLARIRDGANAQVGQTVAWRDPAGHAREGKLTGIEMSSGAFGPRPEMGLFIRGAEAEHFQPGTVLSVSSG
jgi:hypothetical protein